MSVSLLQKPALLVTLTLMCLPLISACVPSKMMGKVALSQQSAYFNGEGADTISLEKLTDRVWTFNWYFDRTMIVETDSGLVIVDPFSTELSEALLSALHKAGLNKPVHTLIYTHYHLDHVRGGEVLKPKNVLCDVKCESYWAKFPKADTLHILPPTQLINGDTALDIGGVKFELFHFGQAHTDTNYGVFLPDEETIYLADTVGIRSLLPVGGVSVFMPDYLNMLEKIENLDFKIFISSHFKSGSKQDFIDAANLQRDAYRWTREAIEQVETDGNPTSRPLIQDKHRFLAAYEYFYDRMQDKYGDFHGFHSQILPTFLANFTAVYVGA